MKRQYLKCAKTHLDNLGQGGIRKNLEYLTLLKTSPICIRKHGDVAHFVMGTAGLHFSSLSIENALLDVLQAADRSEAGKLKRNPFSVQK